MTSNYKFNFAWESPYGRAVKLLDRLPPGGGIVLDLGCGHGAIAEPLRERGHEYVGCDVDKVATDDLRTRGFEAHEIDLADVLEVRDRIAEVVAGRRVAAVTMLDTIEHLPDTRGVLDALRESLLLLGRPTLILSVPNVAHYDLGAKLLTGRWDYTPTGLLDITHVSFFTEDRLTEELNRCGWVEIARNDFSLVHSDQHFPAEHPAFVDGSPLSMLLWSLRSQANSAATVNQFVRAYALSDLVGEARREAEDDQAFLSVLVRTQGRRVANLMEALTCLAAQNVHDFEVLLLVHTTTSGVVDQMSSLVAGFDGSFASRVNVVHVADGGRARPLNVGLDLARGRYLAFLDEDDYVTAEWVGTFLEAARAHPGQIVRSVCVERRTEALQDSGLVAEWQPLGPLENKYGEDFDLLEHFYENRTPIHSFAIPLTTLRTLGLHFDESLPVLEDWDVLIRMASLTGVHDTKKRTAIYQRWVGGESSQASIDHRVWSAAREVVLHRLDGQPLLLPPGSATRIARSCFRPSQAAAPSAEALVVEPPMVDRAEHEALRVEHERLRDELSRAQTEVQRFQQSEFWRATAPLRRLSGLVRRRSGLARLSGLARRLGLGA